MTSLDVYAEQGLLAGIIDDPTLVDDVAKIVSAQDFCEPRHESIFEAISLLRNKGAHIDIITVGNELRTQGNLTKVGGVEYLSTLTDPEAPFAADADPISYAVIVSDESRRRHLERIGKDIIKSSRADSGMPVDDAIAHSESLVRALLDVSGSKEAAPIGTLFDDAMARLEHRASIPGGSVQGIPTGFIDLDAVTTGFHPGQFVILAARPAIGKALAVETPVQTPTGPRAIGELEVGDVIYSWDSTLTHVTAVTETMTDETCYQIVYEGGELIADANHEFPVVVTHQERQFKVVVTVQQMVQLIESGHSLAFPLHSPSMESDVPFDSMDVLRVAHSVFSGNPGPRTTGLTRAVIMYLFDGQASLNAGPTVANEVYDMALSVGLGVTRNGSILTLTGRSTRPISLITQVESVPVRCIEVEHEDHLYLCNDWIVSHNSTLALDFARAAALKADKSVIMFSLEMSRDELMDRLFSAEANVGLQQIRKGELTQADWDAIKEVAQRCQDANLVFDDTPNVTVEHIRAVASRQLANPEGLDLVIIDYLQLMRSAQKAESRQQEVSEFSRNLKLLAKELGVPIIALSQLNRGSENRSDKTPQMSDLRESGSLEQDADIIFLLHRPSTEAANADRTTLIVAKNRNGPTDAITLAPLLAYSKFANGTGMYPTDEPPDDYMPPDDSYAAADTPNIPELEDVGVGDGAAW